MLLSRLKSILKNRDTCHWSPKYRTFIQAAQSLSDAVPRKTIYYSGHSFVTEHTAVFWTCGFHWSSFPFRIFRQDKSIISIWHH